MKLLDRDAFRDSVFKRDGYLCVICKAAAQDAHHILERRLWPDGGYYIENGVSLCGPCHLQAEMTDICCDKLRLAAGITKVVLPPDFYPDHTYSKWGDIILNNGQRMKGPLFHDESVQKILRAGQFFQFYTDYVKYPRSIHLPWSEGQTKDDRTLTSCGHFIGKEVVVSIKYDGENTTIYKDYIHARSIDGRNHWSRSWVKQLQSKLSHELGDYRLCGENLYAKHSVKYNDLEGYFYLFSVWDDKNVCLDWDETAAWAEMLKLPLVEVIYRGIWNEKLIRGLYTEDMRATREGYVVRLAESFPYGAFSKSVAKFVRKGHVDPSNHHWMFTATEKNELK